MNSVLYLSKWGRTLAKQLQKPRKKHKPTVETNRWNIVRGDNVQVINGPQTGQKGKILTVIRRLNRVIVEGVNVRKRAIKPTMDGLPGRMVLQPCSIHYSNVMLIDPSNGEPTKISRKYLEDGTKVRVSKKTGTIIPKPDPMANRKPRSNMIGPKDTLPEDVFAVTYDQYDAYLPHIYATVSRKLKIANDQKVKEEK